MRIVYVMAITISLGLVAQSFVWWSIVPAGFLAGLLIHNKVWHCWWGGFLGAGLLWGIYAAYLNHLNQGILATKMGQLFGNLPPVALILVTALVGGIYGGMGAFTGGSLRKLFDTSKQQV